jgi:hypothetical protein
MFYFRIGREEESFVAHLAFLLMGMNFLQFAFEVGDLIRTASCLAFACAFRYQDISWLDIAVPSLQGKWRLTCKQER